VQPTGKRLLLTSLSLMLLAGCISRAPENPTISPRFARLQPILSDSEVAVVRQTFPAFQPELIAEGFNPNGGGQFTPQNFSPAVFFGPPNTRGMRQTDGGIFLETNGYDGASLVESLPPTGTYFDRLRTPYEFQLGPVELNPLNQLESRMKTSLTSNPPKILLDRRKARVDPADVDLIMYRVRDAVAMRLPAVASVEPRRCEVVIEPTIMYVLRSNFGDVWAGGMTVPLGNGNFRIHVVLFYITGDRRVTDWREFLVSEAINCYVLAVGRSDLAE
jgi:hypothetical protein